MRGFACKIGTVAGGKRGKEREKEEEKDREGVSEVG